jgi:hypothetical protein
MQSLHDIGNKHKTDKAHLTHTFNDLSYLDIYEKYFYELRENEITILEMGVKEGRSLKVWEDYFPNAKIIGLDLYTDNININLKRSKIFTGSQDDISKLQEILDFSPAGFDIVIDDASHLNQMIITSFNFLWPKIKASGFYIIEDLRNSYDWNIQEQMIKGGWNVAQPNGTNLHNDRSVINKLFFDLIKNMDHLSGDMGFMHFWPMLAILGKVDKTK